MELREQAQKYADMGVAVIPIRRGGKKPVGAWQQYQEHRPTAEELEKWFGGKGAPKNIAVVGGAVSENLAVLDFDEVEGYQAWRALAAAERGEAWPDTLPQYRTGRGYHVWLRTQSEINTAFGRVPGTEYEVHIRAKGGYAICPPSVHENGRIYTWNSQVNEIPVVASIPGAQLVAAMPSEVVRAEAGTAAKAPDLKMPKWLTGLLAESIPVGKRHDKLISVCGWARRKLHRRDCLQFMERVNRACCAEPLPLSEISQIAKDLYTKPGPKVAAMEGGLPEGWPIVRTVSPLGDSEREDAPQPSSLDANPMANTNDTFPSYLKRGTDLASAELKPVEWLVDNVIQPGAVTVFVAPSGCIKTWAALWWMRQVCRERGVVALYMDEESGDDELARRFQKMPPGGEENCAYWFYPGLSLDVPEHADRLLDAVRRIDAKLVVIDSMRRVVSGDENTSGAIDLLFSCLKRLKQEGVAVLVLHHARKKGAGGIQEGEMGRGSSDVKAMCDTYIECSDKKSRRILVKWNKMRCQLAPDPKTLLLREDPETGQVELVWTDEEESDEERASRDERILGAVRAHPGLGVRETGIAANVGTGDISDAIRALVAERKLEYRKDGKKKAVHPGPQFPSGPLEAEDPELELD